MFTIINVKTYSSRKRYFPSPDKSSQLDEVVAVTTLAAIFSFYLPSASWEFLIWMRSKIQKKVRQQRRVILKKKSLLASMADIAISMHNAGSKAVIVTSNSQY